MSEPRPVVSATGTETLTEEQINRAMSKEEKKARIARVLDRGFLLDRTTVDNLPPDLHGEWVPRDQVEIERKRAMGFWIDDKYAVNRSIHSDGTGQSIVGDTVFMVCLKEDKQLIDDFRYKQYIRLNGTPDQKKSLGLSDQGNREEAAFKSVAVADGTPVIEESHLTPAVAADKARLNAVLAAETVKP